MMNTAVLEKVNNKRFKSGIEFQKQLLQLTRSIQDQLLANLPSNYSKDRNTNIAEFFRAVSKEFARLQISTSDINEDKYNTETKAEYLYQVLGDSLFLGEKSINENLSDTSYRNFLIKVRNAYYEGSRKQNIEDAVSDIIGLPVTIKELYLELRKQNSFYGLKDTHRMFFDILMDNATSASSIGVVLEDIKFFIDLIKPAHVLYDTRLIWTDQFMNRSGECKPSYAMQDMEYEIYGTSRIYLVTYLATKIYKYAGTDPQETWVEGTIQTIDLNKGIFYLTDNRILVFSSQTSFYLRDIAGDHNASSLAFSVGDVIKYYATKDGPTSSDLIDSTWAYSGVVDEVYQTEQMVTLLGGTGIVYNDSTLVYTRDYNGEYRIEVGDLSPNREIVFKAEKYTKSFDFYKKPKVVQDDFFRQFDSSVIEKPSFQEYVKKDKDIPDNTQEGYDVVIVDGQAVVKKIYSPFYKRDNAKSYKEVKIDKYSLYISGEFQKQFEVDDAPRILTPEESKEIFIEQYGYTGLQESGVNYSIEVAHTGELAPDGSQSIVSAVGDHTEMCDRKATCQLMPMYEDTRKYYTWPDIQLTSGFFDTINSSLTPGNDDTVDDTGNIVDGVTDEDVEILENIVEYSPGQSGDGSFDLPGFSYGFTGMGGPDGVLHSPFYHGRRSFDVLTWHYLSQDPNHYAMPYLPMLGPDALPAEASDVTVYLNGKKIDNAISAIDPWNGIISLNFIPPFNTRLRVDYYYSKRYPDPVYYLKQVVSGIQHPSGNDLVGIFNTIDQGGVVRHLTWPFVVTDPALYGDDRDYQMNKFPILNSRGELATKEEISVFVGTAVATGVAQVVEIYETGSILYNLSGSSWESVSDGDVIVLQAENYLDNTLIYVIESVNFLDGTITLPNSLPVLDAEYPYTIIHFREVPEAVEDVRPLLGHVRLNFLPPTGCFIRINYYYTPYNRNYLMLPDAATGMNPGVDYGASSYTPDTYYGPKNGYTQTIDAPESLADIPCWSFEDLLKIGYRYRAFGLSHSAVLNSEQLILNDGEALNRYNLIFSPEYLTDTDKSIVLNDKYLQKELPAVTTLNPGTPVFAKSFTDDAHHKNARYPSEQNTYNPGLPNGRDLKAGFTIIEPDNSGIIDYNAVCEVLDKRQVNLYSDYRQVEFPNSGYDAPLTTIDDGGSSMPFKFSFIEQYYPNRELRLTDYLDYINQVPTEYKYGSLKILNGSSIAKSMESNFKALNVGDLFTIKDISYEAEVGYTGYIGYSGRQELLEYVQGYGETGFDVRRYRDDDYIITQIKDFETARLDKLFKGKSGSYAYEVTRSKTYAVDVYLNEVQRLLIINGQLGHTYSLPISVLQRFPGYGDTGSHFELNFRDPDPDPYPRNPDNPWIPNPTGISYFDVGYQMEYRFTGSITGGYTGVYSIRSNRINATTGLVRTSQIVDSEGYSLDRLSGFTGPSGALDLGITGPVGDANPRILKPSDSYVVPSGDTGIFLSYSEAEYRVQWRNWDQDMIIVNLGVTGGIMIENPVTLTNDVGDGIVLYFWSVSSASIVELRFRGTILVLSEKVSNSVLASDYTNGLILLSKEDVDRINASADPIIQLSQLHLGDTNYQFYRMIVREILQDDSINVTEIQQFRAL